MTTKRPYAATTTVPIRRSKDEIENELARLQAKKRAILEDDDAGQAVIMFDLADRRYRVMLPLPAFTEQSYRYTPVRRVWRDEAEMRKLWQQDCLARWRALAEYIKSIRIAKESGIITIQDALLAHLVLPSGETVGEWVAPQVNEVYATGHMPALLPGAQPQSQPRRQIAPPQEDEEEERSRI